MDTREFQRRKAAAASRTRAQDQDEAELLAVEDQLSKARDLLISVAEQCPRIAARMENTGAADCVRRFGSLALPDVLTALRDARHDELTAAFHLVNPDRVLEAAE